MYDENGIITFQDVEVRYNKDKPIFQNVTFSLKKGSYHFLTGSSGSGKSSLLKLIYLGHRQYQGTIKILGRDTRHIRNNEIPAFRQKIGVVFQEGNLLEHLNVIDNVALPLRVRNIPRAKAYEQAEQMLSWVNLSHHLYSRLSQLSGGERQRVVIARSVMNKPDILLVDEPTGNVDDAVATRIMHLFEELHKSGVTVILATHNRDLLHEFGHPILHLSQDTLYVLSPLCEISEKGSQNVQNV